MKRLVLAALAAAVLVGVPTGDASAQNAPNTCLCDCYFDRDCAPGYKCDFSVSGHGGSCLTNNLAANCGQASKVCDGVCTQITPRLPNCAECTDAECAAACAE